MSIPKPFLFFDSNIGEKVIKSEIKEFFTSSMECVEVIKILSLNSFFNSLSSGINLLGK